MWNWRRNRGLQRVPQLQGPTTVFDTVFTGTCKWDASMVAAEGPWTSVHRQKATPLIWFVLRTDVDDCRRKLHGSTLK